jgi:predicted site-specific integrase-resolvase
MKINLVERLLLLKEAKSFVGVNTKTLQKWDREGKLYGLRSHKAKKVVSSVKSLVKEAEREEVK